MNRSSIPTKLTDYNVYNEGECLIGIEAEVTLPELAAITSEIAGAGIAGNQIHAAGTKLGKIQHLLPSIRTKGGQSKF